MSKPQQEETTPYTEEELFVLWRIFRNQPKAVRMLQDFGLMDRSAATLLHIKFWKRFNDSYVCSEAETPQYPKAKYSPSDWMW